MLLALELGKYNICVNAVAPGLIDTPLTQNLKPDVIESLIQAQPTKTIGKPEDVANAVAFLGSDEVNFITGQVLYVDGGKSIGSNLF
ncbi:MAG: SDR family oxidoreductase [Sphingobacteriaceae bacterium]|nr:SDR family oxidoreductase [Sphingobacteriaceae bacterium]